MKTKLLKRLRKEAYKKIGISYTQNDDYGFDIYTIGDRKTFEVYKRVFTLEDAQKRLIYFRRKYILDYVKPLIKKRNTSELPLI